jgi:phosphoserine phosphatase
MTVLHIFDMDGTLMRGSSASIELARHLGCLEIVLEHERAAAHGEITNHQFHELCHPLWINASDADVNAAFAAAPWMEGIREVWADIAARGEHSAVISMSPSFWVERLLSWGVGSVHATEAILGQLVVDRGKVLTAASKVVITEQLRGQRSLEASDCIAYGDSKSDRELFSVLEHTVAVNGDIHIERISKISYRGTDMREAYALGRRLISAHRLGNQMQSA